MFDVNGTHVMDNERYCLDFILVQQMLSSACISNKSTNGEKGADQIA